MIDLAVFNGPPLNIPDLQRNPMPVRFRVLVDGEATATRKTVRLCMGAGSQLRETLLIYSVVEHTPYLLVDDRTWLSRDTWLVIVEDMEATPPLYRGALLEIEEAGTYTINMETGSGSEGGDPAAAQAIVRVDRLPAARDVVALERAPDGSWTVAGYGTSAAGALELQMRVRDGRVYAVSVDDYGLAFLPGLAVTPGQRIRPSVFAGVLYEVTEPGTLPVAEPEWWPITVTDSREIGTARAVAVRYYRPLAHGPWPVEMIND